MAKERDAKLLITLKNSGVTPLAVLAAITTVEQEVYDKLYRYVDDSVRNIPVVVGPQGIPGRDGRDGMVGVRGERGLTGKQGARGPRGLKGESGARGLKGERGAQGLRGARGLRGLQGKPGKDGKNGVDGEDGSPDTAQDIVAKINSLPATGAKIDASHISGLPSVIMGGGGLRRKGLPASQVRDDLSSQCDGSTSVFTLKESYKAGTVELFSTQFPIVYRPEVDFTESGTREITLDTGEVSAPASGQTLVALYEKS